MGIEDKLKAGLIPSDFIPVYGVIKYFKRTEGLEDQEVYNNGVILATVHTLLPTIMTGIPDLINSFEKYFR